ncbi:MAG TPA: SDR family oxidoreductase [Vicinamibacterales bacterium]|nr:SDR family oxidoreductase [Vicinamibacterales bacterium]
MAIVTGASRGIGRAIAQTLAAEGMKLSLAARSKDQLDDLVKSLKTDVLVNAVDLRDTQAAQAVVDATMKRFGAIDLLVNNAGATKRGDFFGLTDEDWADGFSLKFFGGMRLSRAAWKHLAASKGTIVNIIGVGGRTGNADFTIGGSVNAAGRLLTKALADRGVKDGVRVNAINPGFIKTERLTVRVKSFAEEHKLPMDQAEAQLAKASGVARFGEPAEIAAAVAFLASPVCGYCHGALLDIDGGQTRTL